MLASISSQHLESLMLPLAAAGSALKATMSKPTDSDRRMIGLLYRPRDHTRDRIGSIAVAVTLQ
jgi:hypothetical protein